MAEHAYFLRTCKRDMRSYGGFQWPESGWVEAPDWNPEPVCGGGLHGLLNGRGDGNLLDWSPDAKWLVFRADAKSVVEINDDKVKVPRAEVMFVGDQWSATDYLMRHVQAMLPVVGATVEAGDFGTAITGGFGTAKSGAGGNAIAGDSGTAIVGDRGTAKAWHYGTAIAGYRGTAMAEYSGTAIVGDRGTAKAGDYGTAMAGDEGIIQIVYRDEYGRHRIATGYVGEDGIEPNVPYHVVDGELQPKGKKGGE